MTVAHRLAMSLESFRGPSGERDHATLMLRDPDGHPLFLIRMPGVTRAHG